MSAWGYSSPQREPGYGLPRTWPTLERPARWKYRDGDGMISAVSAFGKPIELPIDLVREGTRSVLRRLLPGIRATGASPVEQRLMVALAGVESGGAELPVYGDCFSTGPDGKRKWHACGSPGAGPPGAVGYYQFRRLTLRPYGLTFEQLARDPAANHQAALAHIRATFEQHRNDLPTLAALWNAGSIRNGAQPWGAVAYAPDTLSRYAAAWNVAGGAYPAAETQPQQTGGLSPLQVSVLVYLAREILKS